MMNDELLNVMNEDELRNYAHHISNVLDRVGDMIYAHKEHTELLQRLLNSRDYMYDKRLQYDRELSVLRSLEDRLLREHWNDIPHPVPTCECASTKRGVK